MYQAKLIALCAVTLIGLSACAGAPDYDSTAFEDGNQTFGMSNFDECGGCGGWQGDWGHHH